MRKVYLIFTFITTILSCDQNDEPINRIYDNNGQTGVGFTVSSTSITVPEEGITVTIPVQATTVSDEARSFSVSVNQELTTGNAMNYSVGFVSIPAGEYNGELEVSFGEFNTLEDFVTYKLVIDLSLSDDTAVVGSDSVTLSYLKEFVCNDVNLTLVLDTYPEETTWQITNQADGSLVESGGPYDGMENTLINETIFLEDGCYTFTIFDAFSDGICCSYGNGSYKLSCVVTLAEGGEFGAEESTDFCINQ